MNLPAITHLIVQVIAAASIAGGEENGWKQWKYKGENLNEMELEELE